MDLDIYWIADNKITGKAFLPSIEKSKEIVTVKSEKEVDTVIEIALKKDGSPVYPIKRLRQFDILQAIPVLGDNGRLEFWTIKAKLRREWGAWYDVRNN